MEPARIGKQAGAPKGLSPLHLEGDAPAWPPAVDLETAMALGQRLVANLAQVLLGARETLTAAAVAALCGGHLLIEDVPGVGKTVLARALAVSLGAELSRIQGHADLLPSDVTGVSVFAPDTSTWEFRPGPVFSHLVLVDELNRTPPRTQSALLETMEEQQVTVDGEVLGAAPPPPGDRHPEPPVAARHLPAGGKPAGPLRGGHRDRLSRPRRRDATGAAPRRQVRPQRPAARSAPPDHWAQAQAATESVPVGTPVAEYAVELCRATPRRAGGAPGRQPAGGHLAHPLRPGPRPALGPGFRRSRRRQGGGRRLPGAPAGASSTATRSGAGRRGGAVASRGHARAPVRDPDPRPAGRARWRPWPWRWRSSGTWWLVAHNSGAGWVQALGDIVFGTLVIGIFGPAVILARARLSGHPGPGRRHGRPADGSGRHVVHPAAPAAGRPSRTGGLRRPGPRSARRQPAARERQSGPDTVTLLPSQRGVHESVSFDVATAAPFGLQWWTRRVWLPVAAPLHVAPRRGRPVPLPRWRDDDAGDRGRRAAVEPDEIRGTRPYRSGDSRRHMHWPATAHAGELMVRELEGPSADPVTVSVTLPPDRDEAERVAERALGTVLQLFDRGVPVRLATTERSGAVTGTVADRRDAGRRLARAVPGRGRPADRRHGVPREAGPGDPPRQSARPARELHTPAGRLRRGGGRLHPACAALQEISRTSAYVAVALVITGMVFSYHTRARPPMWVKGLVAVAAVAVLLWFFHQVSGHSVPDITTRGESPHGPLRVDPGGALVPRAGPARSAVLARRLRRPHGRGGRPGHRPPLRRVRPGLVRVRPVGPGGDVVVGQPGRAGLDRSGWDRPWSPSQPRRSLFSWSYLPRAWRSGSTSWLGSGGGGAIAVPGALAGDGGKTSELSRPGSPAGPTRVGGYLGFANSLDTALRGSLGQALVMRVRAERPSYWIGETFDRWDGQSWATTLPPPERIGGGSPFFLPTPSGDNPDGASDLQTFYLATSGPDLVFHAESAHEVWFPADDLFLSSDGTVVSPIGLGKGAIYTVESEVSSPSPAELRQQEGGPALSATDRLRYTQLPHPYARAQALARGVTAGAPTTYDQVQALIAWIGANTRYSTNIPPLPRGADTVNEFLFGNRVGFCEQISTSLAVMLRSLGIPAREAVGYVPGPYNPITDLYEVRAEDAHAWVQVWLPGHGWQSFDPTAVGAPRQPRPRDHGPAIGRPGPGPPSTGCRSGRPRAPWPWPWRPCAGAVPVRPPGRSAWRVAWSAPAGGRVVPAWRPRRSWSTPPPSTACHPTAPTVGAVSVSPCSRPGTAGQFRLRKHNASCWSRPDACGSPDVAATGQRSAPD